MNPNGAMAIGANGNRWSVRALRDQLRWGVTSAVDVLSQCRARVDEYNETLRAFVCVDWESAKRTAQRLDDAVAAGQPVGRLAGVPFGVKDMEDCAGMPTECGSLLRSGARSASQDASHIARLRNEGAIPIGKTATPEFAGGLITVSQANGVTRNPWNVDTTPGGSSGGSGAAVAAGMVSFATGSDGGGSLRIPAAFCGLVGMRTSVGRIPAGSREPSGTVCPGVLTRTVADTALLVDIMSGPDPRDPLSYTAPGDHLEDALDEEELVGVRVATSPDLGLAGCGEQLWHVLKQTVAGVAEVEAMTLVDFEPKLRDDPNALFEGIWALDPWRLLQEVNDQESLESLSPYYSDRLRKAAMVTPQDYALYHERRLQMHEDVTEWFSSADVIVTPTISTCDVDAEGPAPTDVAEHDYRGAMAVAPLTRVANLVDLPAVSVPIGMTENSVPIGAHIMTARGRDGLALRVALALEEYVEGQYVKTVDD